MIHERHLFGPGPSDPYPEATNALILPLSATGSAVFGQRLEAIKA